MRTAFCRGVDLHKVAQSHFVCFVTVSRTYSEVLNKVQFSWPLPFSAVVLGISLVTTVAGRDLLHFFATGGSYSWSSYPCPLSLSFCSGTRIEFTRWDVPDPLSVHSKLSILSATIRATVDLVSSCVTMGGMTTRFSRCSLITFHAYSVSISSTRS